MVSEYYPRSPQRRGSRGQGASSAAAAGLLELETPPWRQRTRSETRGGEGQLPSTSRPYRGRRYSRPVREAPAAEATEFMPQATGHSPAEEQHQPQQHAKQLGPGNQPVQMLQGYYVAAAPQQPVPMHELLVLRNTHPIAPAQPPPGYAMPAVGVLPPGAVALAPTSPVPAASPQREVRSPESGGGLLRSLSCFWPAGDASRGGGCFKRPATTDETNPASMEPGQRALTASQWDSVPATVNANGGWVVASPQQVQAMQARQHEVLARMQLSDDQVASLRQLLSTRPQPPAQHAADVPLQEPRRRTARRQPLLPPALQLSDSDRMTGYVTSESELEGYWEEARVSPKASAARRQLAGSSHSAAQQTSPPAARRQGAQKRSVMLQVDLDHEVPEQALGQSYLEAVSRRQAEQRERLQPGGNGVDDDERSVESIEIIQEVGVLSQPRPSVEGHGSAAPVYVMCPILVASAKGAMSVMPQPALPAPTPTSGPVVIVADPSFEPQQALHAWQRAEAVPSHVAAAAPARSSSVDSDDFKSALESLSSSSDTELDSMLQLPLASRQLQRSCSEPMLPVSWPAPDDDELLSGGDHVPPAAQCPVKAEASRRSAEEEPGSESMDPDVNMLMRQVLFSSSSSLSSLMSDLDLHAVPEGPLEPLLGTYEQLGEGEKKLPARPPQRWSARWAAEEPAEAEPGEQDSRTQEREELEMMLKAAMCAGGGGENGRTAAPPRRRVYDNNLFSSRSDRSHRRRRRRATSARAESAISADTAAAAAAVAHTERSHSAPVPTTSTVEEEEHAVVPLSIKGSGHPTPHQLQQQLRRVRSSSAARAGSAAPAAASRDLRRTLSADAQQQLGS